jgi:hypothetical protein
MLSNVDMTFEEWQWLEEAIEERCLLVLPVSLCLRDKKAKCIGRDACSMC